jgi:three-Cys-motif partner protein
MVSLDDYVGREQSYVKHVFLESYLERLVHKTASAFSHIVYVDGFAGPWQSSHELFDDTSFGIALNALRRAKISWRGRQRDVTMSAFLVERDKAAYQKLAHIAERYPDIRIKTYSSDFLAVLPDILRDIPAGAFSFFLVDPKGWRIRLQSLERMLARKNSEIIFNFMFDFINRAASIKDPVVVSGLDELIPFGNWRAKLDDAERNQRGGLTTDERKAIIVEAFAISLSKLGEYEYVAETTVLRPESDRTLYCLFYATRHHTGIEVFRDSQIKAMKEQSITRASIKMKSVQTRTGQGEIFQSLHDMAPAQLSSFLIGERQKAEIAFLQLVPEEPHSIIYGRLWPKILSQCVIRLTDVNKIGAQLRRSGRITFLDWEMGRKVPQFSYRIQRPSIRNLE